MNAQALLDAINRLRQAADADKGKPGMFAAGAIAGALGGAVNYATLDSYSAQDWMDWADAAEAQVQEAF